MKFNNDVQQKSVRWSDKQQNWEQTNKAVHLSRIAFFIPDTS